MARVYFEIQEASLAHFSTLKIVQAPNFANFRTCFLAKLEKCFIIPADTFDYVKGQFAIGFFIWNTTKKQVFKQGNCDMYDRDANYIGIKHICSNDNAKFINEWFETNSKDISTNYIGHLASIGNDFYHQNDVYIDDVARKKIAGGRHTMISKENLMVVSIYFVVRHCIEIKWFNGSEQFFYPNAKWQKDTDFQNDCLAYTLFSNNIQSQYGINYWIPFTEYEVDAPDKFASHFMTDFLAGRVGANNYLPSQFSAEAQAVFNAGRELWKHYMSQKNCNVNASLYDIREHFQGRNPAGKMNNKSEDAHYNELMATLRDALKALAQKIEPKVYAYGFLKG
jgi:hypothetical protein